MVASTLSYAAQEHQLVERVCVLSALQACELSTDVRADSEQRKAVVPIPIKSLAAWHHAVAVLDTSSSATQEAVHGQDVYVWGRGYDFALGTGKRSNWALPSRLRLNSKTLEPDPSPYTAKPSYPFPSASKLQDISLPYSRLQLSGKVEVRGGKKCEETVCVGPSTTAVYYRIVDS